jgi:hypothetical protein
MKTLKICVILFIAFFTIYGALSLINDYIIGKPIISPAKDNLDVWLDNLGRHEGCAVGVKNGELVGTWDNGSYSYGILCFKQGTFIEQVRKYKLLTEATDEELMNYIGDPQFQKKLARLMILDNWNNWRHWYNTTKYKIGYPPKS